MEWVKKLLEKHCIKPQQNYQLNKILKDNGKKRKIKIDQGWKLKKILTLKKTFNIRFKKVNNQITNPAQYNQIKEYSKAVYFIKNSNDKKNIKRNSYSAKQQTIVVEVTRKFKHPFMKKQLKDQKISRAWWKK